MLIWQGTLIGKRSVLKTDVGVKADGGSSPSLVVQYFGKNFKICRYMVRCPSGLWCSPAKGVNG